MIVMLINIQLDANNYYKFVKFSLGKDCKADSTTLLKVLLNSFQWNGHTSSTDLNFERT